MAWILLGFTILLEVAGTTMLKLSSGAAKPGWLAGALVSYGVCFWTLAIIFKTLPVGVAYAIWAGAGTVLIVLVGWLWFGETITALRLLFITMIIVGAVGLHLTVQES